jgi:predicted  nucleic acid-binding Zn-ribbon protein
MPTSAGQVVVKKYVDDEIDAVQTTITGINTRLTTAEAELASVNLPTDLVNLGNDLTALEGRVDIADTNITLLEGRIQTAETELAAGDVATIVSNISSLQTTTTSQGNSITNLTTRVDTLETDNTSNKSRLTQLETNTGGVDLTAVNGRLDTIESDITAIEGDVTSLTSRVTTNETSISSINTSITNINTLNNSQNTRLTNLESFDTTATNRLNNLETYQTSSNTRITNIENSDTTQNTRLSDLEADVAQNTTDISTNATNITTNTNDINSLESRQADFSDFDINKVDKTLDLDGYNLTVAQLSLSGNSINDRVGDGLYLVPSGGATGQVLAKNSNTSGDFVYKTLAKADVGLGNVDNTSDANKPISTLTQSALDAKAPINNPTFTGTITAPNLTLSGVSTATQSDVLYIASNGVISKGSAPSGGGGTTQTINTINYNAKPFFGPSGVTSTNYGSTTLGPGFYSTNSNGWLTPSGGVCVIPFTDLCYDSNNRNFQGALEIFARNTSSSSPKNAYAQIALCLRPGASSMSFTLNLQFNQSISSWGVANGGTQNIRVNVDSDCFVCWAFRGCI